MCALIHSLSHDGAGKEGGKIDYDALVAKPAADILTNTFDVAAKMGIPSLMGKYSFFFKYHNIITIFILCMN